MKALQAVNDSIDELGYAKARLAAVRCLFFYRGGTLHLGYEECFGLDLILREVSDNLDAMQKRLDKASDKLRNKEVSDE